MPTSSPPPASIPVRLLNRRGFCKLVGAGCAALAVPGCGGDPGPAVTAMPDLSTVHDLAKLCPNGGAVALKAATSLKVNQAVHLAADNIWVVRDAQGLFAVTDVCTHQGSIISYSASLKRFHCPMHGSDFDQNGEVVTGPAVSPLDHYALCVESNGDAVVDSNNIVDPGQRA